MILVTGATGTVGSEVVHALRRRDVEVRAFVRDVERAREKLGEDVELAVGDFADAAAVEAALDGAECLLLSCADDPRRVAWETAAVDQAAAAGIERVVRLSTTSAAPGAPVAFWDWHGQVEEYLRASPVPSVIIQSSFYMSNLLANADQVAREGTLVAPLAGARIAMIDPRDVGDAAAAVLAGAGADGETYAITGPEAVSYEDVAGALSDALGRDVRFVDVPDEDTRQGVLGAGLPAFVADQVVAVFQQLRLGVAAEMTGTFESLTGNAPRGIAEFVRDHAFVFAPSTAGVVGERAR